MLKKYYPYAGVFQYEGAKWQTNLRVYHLRLMSCFTVVKWYKDGEKHERFLFSIHYLHLSSYVTPILSKIGTIFLRPRLHDPVP